MTSDVNKTTATVTSGARRRVRDMGSPATKYRKSYKADRAEDQLRFQLTAGFEYVRVGVISTAARRSSAMTRS